MGRHKNPMKRIIKLTTLLGSLAFATTSYAAEPADQGAQDDGHSEGCAGACCGVDVVKQDPSKIQHYVVKGIKGQECSKSIARRLQSLDGVTVEKICLKSGLTVVKFDPKKIKESTLTSAITEDETYEIAGTRYHFYLKGMNCDHCVESVREVLTEMEGVALQSVDGKTKLAVVDIDPSKSTRASVVRGIEAAGYAVSLDESGGS